MNRHLQSQYAKKILATQAKKIEIEKYFLIIIRNLFPASPKVDQPLCVFQIFSGVNSGPQTCTILDPLLPVQDLFRQTINHLLKLWLAIVIRGL